MGTVFSARDEKLDRLVAVKLLKEELASDARFVERFRREARAAAALSHPNVASVFDYGEDEGRYFIVMELVEGRDLARVMREDGPLGTDRALAIAEQIARALGHAHAAGLVHRDVKPHNVIVMDEDRVKVTDFGIARATGDSALTATGTILGTAQYISPEQAAGETPVPSSDVYSLGIVLYEMLTGAVPFTGDSPVSVALRHVRDEVPLPSAIDPAIPPETDDLVATATAKDPARRFRDGNGFAAAIAGESLAPATEELPSGDTAAWPFTHPPRWDPRRLGRIVVTTFAVLFLVALAALGIRLASSDLPRERRVGPAERSQRPSATTDPGIAVDDYRGLPADEAAARIEAAGLEPVVDRAECGQDRGFVCEQTPEPGATVTGGDSVTLVVSTSAGKDGPVDDDGTGKGKSDKVPPGQAKKDKDDD